MLCCFLTLLICNELRSFMISIIASLHRAYTGNVMSARFSYTFIKFDFIVVIFVLIICLCDLKFVEIFRYAYFIFLNGSFIYILHTVYYVFLLCVLSMCYVTYSEICFVWNAI